MKSDNTVERTIFFGVIDWRFKNKSVDVLDVFDQINKLPLADGSRYYQTSDGQRYEILLDKFSPKSAEIFGCIGDSRITDLPFLEKQGAISPLRIGKGEGIFDAMHFMIRRNKKGTWIITYEFNFHAPRVTAINIYVRNKIASHVDYVAIEPITGEPVDRVLSRIRHIKKIRMGIHSGADMSRLSVGLANALKALKHEQDGTFIDIEFSVRRSRDRTLSGNIIQNIPSFFRTIDPQIGMEHFVISGIRNDTGQPDEVNLMNIVLKEKTHIEKMDKDYRFVDPRRMYAALVDAYNTHQGVINRV